MTDDEGFGYSSYDGHAILKSGYSYAPTGFPNGNLLTRNGWNLGWSHENRLAYVAGPGTDEFYLCDDQGMRVKKTVGGTSTYYVNQYYEVSGSTVTKYYYSGITTSMRCG